MWGQLRSQPQEFPEVLRTPAMQTPWPGWEVTSLHKCFLSLLGCECAAALSSHPGANGGAFRHQKYPTINSAVTEIKEASCMEEYLACFQVLANTKPHQSKEALGVYDVEITGWCVTHFQLMVSHLLEGNVLDILGLDSSSLLQAKCHGHEASVSETEYPAMCREGRDQGTLGIITSQLFSAQMRWWGKVFCNSRVQLLSAVVIPLLASSHSEASTGCTETFYNLTIWLEESAQRKRESAQMAGVNELFSVHLF